MPTPTDLECLQNTDMSRLSPYVKKVNFVAPLHSWTLEYDTFEEIVVAQAIGKHFSGLELEGGRILSYHDPGSTGADARQRYIDKHWNGISPFSREQLQAGFQAYRAEAEAVKMLLRSDALRAAWTHVLQTLRHARSFSFSSSEWDEERGDYLPLQPDCVVEPHPHYSLHDDEPCGKALAVVGDAVFAAGIACLSDAGVEVEALRVACVMTTSFGWEDLPGWESLNLSSMRRFKFQPRNGRDYPSGRARYSESVSDNSGGQYDDDKCANKVVAQRANKAIASAMKKSASHLEYFEYDGGDSLFQWPGEEVIPLARLLRLKLDGGEIEATNFQKWMTGMPSLRELYLKDTGVTGFRWYEWLNVFDAIRDHPKSMKVRFEQVHHCDWAELSINYDTSDYEKFLDMEEGDDWIHDKNRSLSLYLSGKGRYDRIMRDMLGDDPEEDEEDEQDETWDDENSADENSSDENSNDQDTDGKDSDDKVSGNH